MLNSVTDHIPKRFLQCSIHKCKCTICYMVKYCLNPQSFLRLFKHNANKNDPFPFDESRNKKKYIYIKRAIIHVKLLKGSNVSNECLIQASQPEAKIRLKRKTRVFPGNTELQQTPTECEGILQAVVVRSVQPLQEEVKISRAIIMILQSWSLLSSIRQPLRTTQDFPEIYLMNVKQSEYSKNNNMHFNNM